MLCSSGGEEQGICSVVFVGDGAITGWEAGKHEYQYSGWGRVGVRPASWSLEDSLRQRMLQLTTVPNPSMAVTSPHLPDLGLKRFIGRMNLRLSQQLLSEQEVGWDQPETPIKSRKPPKGAQGLYSKNILLLDLIQNWRMWVSGTRAAKEPRGKKL